MSEMTFQDDWEGVEVDTPVGSFRAGRGRGDWNDDADYRSVRRSVRRRMGFFRHVSTAVSLLAILLIIDIITGPDDFWVQWVALIWAIILGVHFLNAFVFNAILGREAEHRMVERELRKRKSSG